MVKVKLNQVVENELNSRSMEDDAIKILAESIQTKGLLEPPVVYEKGEKYVLLSGHKRFNAIKMLFNSGLHDNTMPVTIVDKPNSSVEEELTLCEANIHRLKPSEVQNEVQIANRLWNTMSVTKKNEYTHKLKARFIELNGDNHDFIRANFRPRLEFIKRATGLDVSNSTVKKLLVEEPDEETNTEETANSTNTPRPVTAKQLTKAITSLLEKMNNYKNVCLDDNIIDGIEDIESRLQLLQAKLDEFI